jgi:hypothetical protein
MALEWPFVYNSWASLGMSYITILSIIPSEAIQCCLFMPALTFPDLPMVLQHTCKIPLLENLTIAV